MTDNPEKRDSDRLEHPVLVAYRTVDRFLSDFGTNISSGGVFVNTREPMPVDTRVRLLISLPDREEPYELLGRVVRVHAPGGSSAPGMAIEFLDLDEAMQVRLDALVVELRGKLGQGDSDA